MPTRDTRKARLAADVAELRQIAAQNRADLRALPAAASRTPAQRTSARRLRQDLIVARIVLNALSTPDDADLDDAT
jgi:hypothetical protein